MNKFGVIELAGGKVTTAPGWAYVPDVGPNPGAAGAQTAGNRKRARNGPGGTTGLSVGDLSARQEAKARKEFEALDRDCGRDNSISLPPKTGRGDKGSVKHTPNVRRILQSQKTFANHLDDFLALQALADASAGAHGGSSSGPGSSAKRSSAAGGHKKDAAATGTAAGATAAKQPGKASTAPTAQTTDPATTPNPILTPSSQPAPPPPPSLPGDDNPLLASRVPSLPPDEELRALLMHPPLTYLEARGAWEEGYPEPAFCEVCGYWGRVRCIKCGTRVCALDCLEVHREECVTRYGL